MSSLNKAFIQVYKKSTRPAESEHRGGPHFPRQELPSSPVVPDESKLSYHRFDNASNAAALLQPWLTSISTIGIDEYIASSNVALDSKSTGVTLETKSDAIPAMDVAAVEEISIEEVVVEEESPVAVEFSRVEMKSPASETRSFRSDPSHVESRSAQNARVFQNSRYSRSFPASPSSFQASPSHRAEQTPEARKADPSPVEPVVEPLPMPVEENPVFVKDMDSVDHSMTESEPSPFKAAASVIYHPRPVEETPMMQADLPFQSVWEVDEFQWPSLVLDIQRREPTILAETGKHLRLASQSGLKILAVTSENASQGRSTVSLCLARSAAKSGLRVALVDADLHHPDLAERLNLEMAHGWEEVVSSGLPLEESAIHSLQDRITLIPLSCKPNPLQLSPDHPKVQNILRRLAMSFDLVIVDSQHLSHPSGRLVGGGIDSPINAAVLVVDRSTQGEELIQDCMRRLTRQGIESVGIVENFQ